MAYNLGYVDVGGYNLGYTGAFTGGPSISAADDATEAQVATVTLANNADAPTELRLGGTVVAFTFDAGVMTYTAPLLPNNPSLTLEVDVDGVTISETIAYTNTYDMTHTPAEVDADSIIPESSFGTTQLVELKVVTDADSEVLTVNWAAYDADNFESAVSDFVTAVSEVEASTDVVIGYHITETGATGTFTRTLTVDAVQADETPDAFSFTAQTNVALSEIIESNAITVTGVDAATDIPASIVGGEYAVSTDGGENFGAWTSANTNVQLNHQIKVRVTSSAANDTEVTATLTVGGVSDTFSVTTIVAAPASAPTFGEPTIGQTAITQPTSYAGSDAESFEYSLGDGNWIAYTSPIELTGLSTNQSVTIRSRAVTVGGEGPIATTTLTTLPATGVGTGLSNSITAGAAFDVAATPPALEANQALVAFIQNDTDVYWLTINSVGGGLVNVTAPNDLPVFAAGQGVLKIEVREFSS